MSLSRIKKRGSSPVFALCLLEDRLWEVGGGREIATLILKKCYTIFEVASAS